MRGSARIRGYKAEASLVSNNARRAADFASNLLIPRGLLGPGFFGIITDAAEFLRIWHTCSGRCRAYFRNRETICLGLFMLLGCVHKLDHVLYI